MAERERERLDGRAIRIGIHRFIVATIPVGFVFLAIRFAISPPLRDFGKSGWIPDLHWTIGAAVAVGGLLGFAAMRGARRVTGVAGRQYAPGSSALDRTRDNIAAERGAGPAVPRTVQRWSHDLLAGSDPFPSEEVIADA